MSDQYEFKMGMYLGELQQPFEQSLATARDLGAHYVWCGTHSNNRSLYELADDEIDQAAEQVAAHGLEFFLIDGAGLFKTVHLAELEPGKMLEHDQFKEHFTKLERAMEVSARSGDRCGRLQQLRLAGRVHRRQAHLADAPGQRAAASSPTGDMEKLVEAFSLFADIAEKYDVDIAFLMMQWNYGNTSRNFRRIVEAVGSRRFKALWCPADNYNCGEVDNATAGFEKPAPLPARRPRQGSPHHKRLHARIRIHTHRRGPRRLPNDPAQPARQSLRRRSCRSPPTSCQQAARGSKPCRRTTPTSAG